MIALGRKGEKVSLLRKPRTEVRNQKVWVFALSMKRTCGIIARFIGRGGRAAEGAPLLRVYGC